MITKVKYTDLENTQVKITLEDGREMFAGITGSTWLHTELRNWLTDKEPEPFMTTAELAQKALDDARADFKSTRESAVGNLKVTVDGMVFDGDETSQTRMARAIAVMNDVETTLWVLANNTPVQVSRAQLTQALKLAGAAQTAIWV